MLEPERDWMKLSKAALDGAHTPERRYRALCSKMSISKEDIHRMCAAKARIPKSGIKWEKSGNALRLNGTKETAIDYGTSRPACGIVGRKIGERGMNDHLW